MLATVYEEQGESAQALQHYKQFHSLKEQVFNEENESKFKRLSASYQLKQAEAEAQYQKVLYQEEQRHSQRLQVLIDELESFSYSVSHDLRAPLRSITGFSQILLEDFAQSLDEEGQGYLHKTVRAGQRMESLIDDLLRLSRVTRAEVQIMPVNLSLLVQEIANHLHDTQPQRQVEWVISPDIKAQADGGLMRLVLENLLNNAWKYSGKRQEARIEFGCHEVDGERVYFVRDNGAGFDMAYANKLFKVFQRLHRADEFEGTGVGLATVKRVIAKHGGRIWAEAAPGLGATFSFTLQSTFAQPYDPLN